MVKVVKKVRKNPKKVIKKKVTNSTKIKTTIPKISFHLIKSRKLMLKYGFKINEIVYNKSPIAKKEEMIIEGIQDLLKAKYDELYDELMEKRKAGKDLFIQELKMRQLLAKQKICFSTMNYKDLEKYMNLLNKIKESAK